VRVVRHEVREARAACIVTLEGQHEVRRESTVDGADAWVSPVDAVRLRYVWRGYLRFFDCERLRGPPGGDSRKKKRGNPPGYPLFTPTTNCEYRDPQQTLFTKLPDIL
jgi:hypothetical protein